MKPASDLEKKTTVKPYRNKKTDMGSWSSWDPEAGSMTEQLRRQAEDLLDQASENSLPAAIDDINKLHHELAVHQAELELQNEELRHTQLSLQKVRDRYVELYEHAPVGYVLLDADGIIRHSNATWRAMLKRPDDNFHGIPFADTLVAGDARLFLSRFRSLFQNPADKQIELQIKRHQTKPFYAHITAKRTTSEGTENGTDELMIIVSNISERKQTELYRDIGREVLQILNEPNDLKESIQRVLATLKTRTKVDAVGLRLLKGEDFPYFAQDGFSADFMLTENTLHDRSNDGGGVCRDKDGNVCLECTCGLVISGRTDASNPLFTKGGSCWTNDSSSLLDLPSDQDPRTQPRNNCIHQGYASVALIPVRTKERIVGLIQLNDKRPDRFTLESIEMLEDIATHIGSALMRRRAEEALRESEMSLRQVIDLVPHFIFSKDVQGTYLLANKAIADAYGTTPENLLGKSDYDFSQNTEEADFFLECDKKVMERGAGLYGVEEVITDAQGSRRFLKTSKIPFTPFGTNTPAILGVAIDITENKQAQLKLQQKNHEMEQFVYSVSHDLKSPLVTVKTFTDMLRQDLQDGDQQQIADDLNYIERGADKMQHLLDALLQYSRIGTGDSAVQNLRADQQVQDCLTALAGIIQQYQIEVSIGNLSYLLHGDPLHFGQIWQNLIENAVKYKGDQPQIEIGATQEGKDVVFYVRDNGMGIAPEHSERIFNLFSQLNPGSDGSGLGLALVKKIVSIYQGRIWVESEGKGKGSCFYFTLPGALIKDNMATG